MIILVPLLVFALVLWILKLVFIRIDQRMWVYLAAISVGWGGYGVVGALIPHADPQIWHYLSAPALGGLALIIGFMIVRVRGIAF
jgi:hypothetical protein